MVSSSRLLTPMVVPRSALNKPTRRSILPSIAAYMMGKRVGDSRVMALIFSPYGDKGWLFRLRHSAGTTVQRISECCVHALKVYNRGKGLAQGPRLGPRNHGLRSTRSDGHFLIMNRPGRCLLFRLGSFCAAGDANHLQWKYLIECHLLDLSHQWLRRDFVVLWEV